MRNPNSDNVFPFVSALSGRTGLAQLENDVRMCGGMGFHATGVVLNTAGTLSFRPFTAGI
jgi:hypothetical protein